jgi:hypothetical protein
MSVSSITAATPAPATASHAATNLARAADGDYKAPNARTSHVKDADGDYKPIASPAATSSTATQAALTTLKTGG